MVKLKFPNFNFTRKGGCVFCQLMASRRNVMTNFSMKIKYWGVRGSVPAPLPLEEVAAKQFGLVQRIIEDGGTEKLFGAKPEPEAVKEYLHTLPFPLVATYGGDTTCIEVQAKNSPLVIIDAGTGIRQLGKILLGRLFSDSHFNPLNSDQKTKRDLHMLFTHYHWDHIQGFPFFAPAFMGGGRRVNFYFYGKKDTRMLLSEVLKGQQQYPNFPVVWDEMPCAKKYFELNRLYTSPLNLGDLKISYQELSHPDSVFAYRFDVAGKSFVCATDNEHRDVPDPRLLKLARNADILYYDAQYTPEEYVGTPGSPTGAMPKIDWGHSTYEWAILNSLAANIKTVVLGHHDPVHNDFQMEEILKRASDLRDQQLRLPENKGKTLEVVMAYQGLEQTL